MDFSGWYGRFLAAGSAVFLSVLLAGCISEPDPETLNDPLFKSGYADGCRTAHTRVEGFEKTVHRNEALYKKEDAYRDGWRQGYHSCGGGGDSNDGGVFNERGTAQPWDTGRF